MKSSITFLLILIFSTMTNKMSSVGRCGNHPFVKNLPTEEEIQNRINEKLDKLTCETKDKERKPYACIFCDEYLLKEDDMQNVTLKALEKARDIYLWANVKDARRTKELEAYYTWNGNRNGCTSNLDFLKGMCLSPRAQLESSGNGRRGFGFKSCQRCYLNSLKSSKGDKKFLPRHAILNRNYNGAAPKCLMDLTEVELAFLTPVKNYGYCFTWRGGKKDVMKGSLSFMKVKPKAIGNGIGHLNSLGLNGNIVCLHTGKMTKAQKQRAKEESEIRLDYVTAALKWLIANNVRWKDVDYDQIVQNLEKEKPVILDRTQEVESVDKNTEETALFTVFYPDGATTQTNGGFENAEDFKKYVQEMSAAGFDAEFQFNVEKEYFKGNNSDLLLDACLLQFPYGICSQHERRVLQDGSFDEKSTLTEYLQALSKKSDPVFQRPLFQLITYSMACKSKLLRSSRLQLRGKTDAANLADGLNKKDVISAINGRRLKNRYAGTDVSRRFLDAVDATGRALPHTNECTKVNRGKGEAMQHHFGMSSVFCTTTFDDENSFLMQVMAGTEIDDDTPIEDLTDEELSKRAKLRRDLRLKYPGLAAMNFEMKLEILMSEVIGWDMEKNCSNGKTGYFGKPYAIFFAVEEQGRNTLHVHMMIWIEGYSAVQKSFLHGTSAWERNDAEEVLKAYHQHCASTEFFPTQKRQILKAFDHECDVPILKRKVPQVVTDQELRNLRNKWGYKDAEGKFAQCPDCLKKWTYEELVALNLRQFHGITQKVPSAIPTDDDEQEERLTTSAVPKARCLAIALEHQKAKKPKTIPKAAINAAYQHHVSCHVDSCFKCKKKGSSKKRKHVCGPNCECRCRMPDRKRVCAKVYGDEKMTWFDHRGNTTEQTICQLIPKRNEYDLCQNVACNAISQSKFTCNSNVSVITEGPAGQYPMKYTMMYNQDEEQAAYCDVEHDMKRMAENRERVHQDERREALRLITRAAFAHNRGNIISAPFASYFLRNESRFYFSHEFTYCPLRDVIRLLNQQEIRGMLMYNSADKTSFFENLALNYLCRNEKLDRESLRSFMERYESCYIPRENDDEEVLPFEAHCGQFKHPSVVKSGFRKGKCNRGSRLREEPTLIQVSQWMFNDTADFQGDILTCSESEMNTAMESYAEVALCLLYPLRQKNDIQSKTATKFKHTHKLQEVYQSDEYRKTQGLQPVFFTEKNIVFSQNIQNARSNSLRFKLGEDELSSLTEPYVSPNSTGHENNEEEKVEEEPEATYEEFSQLLEEDGVQINSVFDSDPKYLPEYMNEFRFDPIKNKGTRGCGWDDDIPTPELKTGTGEFLSTNNVLPTNNGQDPDERLQDRKFYKVQDVVRLHLARNRPKVAKTIWDDKQITVSSATGTIKSIREWAKAAFQKDKCQERAFEVIISSFLLTFYEESAEDATDPTQTTTKDRSRFRQMRNKLKALRGLDKREINLIMLLHGPGGSGKSTVMNAVKAYARDFCLMLGHPFTDRTIVTTAMSGVAATLIKGETTHSVIGFNRDTVQEEEVRDFSDARLLIIDEISFAAPEDFELLHEKLILLMRNHFNTFGGLNVVFAGDYSQLEPVKRDPVYKNNQHLPMFHGALNCYVELEGNWRFSKDPEWGEVNRRFREGKPTIQDVNLINTRFNRDNVPRGIQVASYANQNRDAVNSSVFEDFCSVHGSNAPGKYLKSAVMALMDQLEMTTSAKAYTQVTSNAVKKWFYENCGESDVEVSAKKGRVDPVLKLCPNAPFMLTKNEDVGNGEANGTRVFVKGARTKRGENSFKLKLECGTIIDAIFASQVDAIALEHENQDISPRLFECEPKKWTFTARVEMDDAPETLKMKGQQFPIISNTCTTGHKLQGCSVENLLVNDWHYGSNWAYVVLSRVKTLQGLFLREELSDDLEKYNKPPEMKEMLKRFSESKIAVKYLDDEEYAELEKTPDYVPPAPGTPSLNDETNF